MARLIVRASAALVVTCLAALPAATAVCAFVCHEDAAPRASHHAHAQVPTPHHHAAAGHDAHAVPPSSSEPLAARPSDEDCDPRASAEPALAGFVREDLSISLSAARVPQHVAMTVPARHADRAVRPADQPLSSAPPAAAGLPLRI